MYTLRTFKDPSTINRVQVYLGDSYELKQPSKEDEELGIIIRVVGNYDSITRDGICIYKNDFAFIMTHLGGTFEVLNRPDKR